jgi:uncharacterized membrane protein YeaQ/YmgE (transglycosylase-associated protein family)
LVGFITTLLIGLGAGALSGFLLGWLHHQLKPLHLHQLFNYAIGSVSCLLAAITAVVLTNAAGWLAALVMGEVWGLSGLIVLLSYGLDALVAKKRARKHVE